MSAATPGYDGEALEVRAPSFFCFFFCSFYFYWVKPNNTPRLLHAPPLPSFKGGDGDRHNNNNKHLMQMHLTGPHTQHKDGRYAGW
jgi:hypothetical protein